MRLIKLAIISAIVLFTLVFLMSLLIPSHVRISRAVNIPGQQAHIMARLSNLDDWRSWNEVVKNAGKLEYRGPEQKLSGEKLEISLARTTTDSIFTVWTNQHGKQIAGVLCTQQEGGITIVQFYFDFHQRWYPWEKFASINLDKQWGPPMEKSLENLKKIFGPVQ
jgi:hypothetical protein